MFDLPGALAGGEVTIEIFDASGRRASRIHDAHATPGRHEIVWDGSSASGNVLAAGAYFARLTAGDAVATARVTLVR